MENDPFGSVHFHQARYIGNSFVLSQIPGGLLCSVILADTGR